MLAGGLPRTVATDGSLRCWDSRHASDHEDAEVKHCQANGYCEEQLFNLPAVRSNERDAASSVPSRSAEQLVQKPVVHAASLLATLFTALGTLP